MPNSLKKAAFILRILSVFIAFMLHWASTAQAQNENYKHYTLKDGLPSNTVYQAYQDSKGFIWFSTDAGVSRFDGISFKNYSMDDGLSDDEVFQIKEDSKGRIWFMTFNGKLSYFFNNKFYNQENDSLIHRFKNLGFIFSIYEDAKHNLWFGRSSRLITMLGADGKLVNYDLPKEGFQYAYEPYFFYEDGIKCLTRHGIFKLQNKHFVKTQEGDFDDVAFKCLPFHYSDSEFYFFNKYGISVRKNKRNERLIPPSELPNCASIMSMNVTQEKDIWTCSLDDQTTHYKLIKGKYVFQKSYLKGNLIVSIFIDKENNTWFCSQGNGVFLHSDLSNRTLTFTEQSGLIQNHVVSVYYDKFNNLWIGYRNGMVSRFDGKSMTHYSTSIFTRPLNRILQFVSDTSGNVFIASDEGFSVFLKTPDGFSKPKFIGFEDEKIKLKLVFAKGIYRSKDNQINFLVSFHFGEIKSKNGRYYLAANANSIYTLGNRNYTEYIDSNGVNWISTVAGLTSYNGKVRRTYNSANNWLKGRLSKIDALSDGNLLLASYGFGVGLFDGKKLIKTLSISDGLGSNTCNSFSIVHDTIYFATNKGITSFVYQKGNFKLLANYNTNEGLITEKVNGISLGNGKIYAATAEGLSVLPIYSKKVKQADLLVSINYFLVDGEYQNLKQNSVFDYTKNHFQLNFKAPVFQHPEFVSYQIKISGRDTNWISTKNDFVELFGMPPGEYSILIRAKYQNTVSKNEARLNFTITPPFWKRTWFRLMLILLFILFTYYVIRRITKRKFERRLLQYEQERALTEERNRIANEMHDDVGADLSNLLLRMRIIESKNIEPSTDFDSLQFSTRNIIHKIDEIIWSLNSRRDTLNELIDFIVEYYETLLEDHKLGGQLKIPSSIPVKAIAANTRRNIFLAVKEVLNNALKHAHASKIDLMISCEDNLFRLVIRDHGHGFDKAKIYSGNGLANIQKRLSDCQGRISFESEKQNGTVVTLEIELDNLSSI